MINFTKKYWEKPAFSYNLFSLKTKNFGKATYKIENTLNSNKVRTYIDLGFEDAFLFGYEFKFKFGLKK